MVSMAAVQKRKRLNSDSTGCSSWEHYGNKNKRIESSQNDLNVKSHISLTWDSSQGQVVAKKEQIGVSWRDLRTFVDYIPRPHNILADVLTIPQEKFDLENLTEVLSYQVWQTHLSDKERNFLLQFLPREQDAQQVVQELLGGINFHFGNPFLEWGTSLCSGNRHPDEILSQEKRLKADKEIYYMELQKYHHDMIEYFQNLKGKWESCRNPEMEILQKIWRKRQADGNKVVPANDPNLHLDDNVAATSDSSSLMPEEKVSTSDNDNSLALEGGDHQKRLKKKGLKKDKHKGPVIASNKMVNGRIGPIRGTINKREVQHSDGAEYMSYVKISKKQYELVKSMKQTGKSIQSRTLDRILGNHNSWHIQPYEVFVEEEHKKLRDHWLELANKDIPAAYKHSKQRQFQIRETIKLLEQDIKKKLRLQTEDEEMVNDEILLQDHSGCSTDEESHSKDEEDAGFVSLQNQLPQQISSLKATHYLNSTAINAEKDVVSLQSRSLQHISSLKATQFLNTTSINAETGVVSLQSRFPQLLSSPQQISSLKGTHYLNIPTINAENIGVTSRSSNASPDGSIYSVNVNTSNTPRSHDMPISSSGDVWSHPCYESTGTTDYVSTSGFIHPHQVVNEGQCSYMMSDEANRKHLPQRQSFPNHDRNELLQSLYKTHGMLPYHHQEKQAEFDFPIPSNVLLQDQFPVHLQDRVQPLLPLEQREKSENVVYMQQRVSDDIYSNGGGYLIPRQEQLPPSLSAQQQWGINSAQMSPSLQSNINGGELLQQSWFPTEHQVHECWTGSDSVNVQNQTIDSASSADQSLFSMLPQCNQLRTTSTPYHSMDSSEQLLFPRSYGNISGMGPRMSNAIPQGAINPVNYLGGRDAGVSSMMPEGGMGWVNLQQNSVLHDPMGKHYLGSWNRQ